MANAQTTAVPQRGVLRIGLTPVDLADIEGGITVRVPNGRYFVDIALSEPAVVTAVDEDESDEAYS